jgi:hypothetical protein
MPAMSTRGGTKVDPEQRKSIFVSYAHRDGCDLASELRTQLTAAGFDTWIDTRRLTGGSSWTREIENALDASSVVIALLTPGSYDSEMCRCEQLRALRKGKQLIPVMAKRDAEVPVYLESTQRFDLSDPGNRSGQINDLLDAVSKSNINRVSEDFQHTTVNAPSLPRKYVILTEAFYQLRERIIAEEPGYGVAITAAGVKAEPAKRPLPGPYVETRQLLRPSRMVFLAFALARTPATGLWTSLGIFASNLAAWPRNAAT